MKYADYPAHQTPGLNPFLPFGVYIPDGEPKVFAGRLYLYGSFDRFDSGYCCDVYHAVSAPLCNLTDWTDHGVAFSVEDVPWSDALLYAPDALYHDGKYYLQYACPGAEYNTYADGVYVSDSPLGPFALADNNPYSYKPGGFLPGAGHGSTMEDLKGNLWHTATMRISVNHPFERRVGLWPAGFDKDGELFCNQRYGDWPMSVSDSLDDPWREPEWMLLSSGKTATASSFCHGNEPKYAIEENVQTWWRARTNRCDEWLQLDLGAEFDVRAIQINFADDHLDIPCPGEIRPGVSARYIDETEHVTQWALDGSLDGKTWFVIEDKTDTHTDLTHDLIVREDGIAIRYLRLSNIAVAFDQPPCVSGLRVFGKGYGKLPPVPRFTVKRTGELDMEVNIEEAGHAVGYNILFGTAPDKLYHSYMVFQTGVKRIGALVRGRHYFVRVDAFNENGISHGTCVELKL